MVTQLTDSVYWVGVVDWHLRHFHGHELSTHRGSTYNAYLIVDEKIVLVDSVWGPFRDQLVENIRQVVEPARIDLVVVNHSEPDHSGGLATLMEKTPKAQVVVSKRGEESVEGYYHQKWKFKTVQTGERINIGANDLVFIEAPMLHWPDSMFTYVDGQKILLPNDAFGQHYATALRFNDEVDQDELYQEALKYYANILTPFSGPLVRKIEEALALNLDIEIIAPSHGVIWRKDPLQIVKKYREWAAQIPERRAVILYDTMWNATHKMAEAIGKGLASSGVPCKLFYMPTCDRNDVITEIFRAHAIVVGSSTVNNGILPTITPILEDIRGLRFQNKVGAAFGSYGWSGESVKIIEEHLTRSKIPLVAPGVRAKWSPRTEDLVACEELGCRVAKAMGEAESTAGS